MTEKEYRSHPAISRSELWRMNESPEKFKWFKDNPPPATDALLQGQIIHKLLLEPDTFSEQFVVGPNVDGRTKDGKKALAEFAPTICGRTVITQKDYDLAKRMVEKCLSDDEVVKLLSGAHEQEFFWTDDLTGEQCKCRVDCLTEIDGEPVIIDYKTTANAATYKFNRDLFSWGYHFQAAMYGEGVRVNLGLDKLPRFIFIAQEKKPPYSINRIEATDDVILLGYDKFRELLGMYHDCKTVDEWPGYNGLYNELNEAYLLEWVKDDDSGDE